MHHMLNLHFSSQKPSHDMASYYLPGPVAEVEPIKVSKSNQVAPHAKPSEPPHHSPASPPPPGMKSPRDSECGSAPVAPLTPPYMKPPRDRDSASGSAGGTPRLSAPRSPRLPAPREESQLYDMTGGTGRALHLIPLQTRVQGAPGFQLL